MRLFGTCLGMILMFILGFGIILGGVLWLGSQAPPSYFQNVNLQ